MGAEINQKLCGQTVAKFGRDSTDRAPLFFSLFFQVWPDLGHTSPGFAQTSTISADLRLLLADVGPDWLEFERFRPKSARVVPTLTRMPPDSGVFGPNCPESPPRHGKTPTLLLGTVSRREHDELGHFCHESPCPKCTVSWPSK